MFQSTSFSPPPRRPGRRAPSPGQMLHLSPPAPRPPPNPIHNTKRAPICYLYWLLCWDPGGGEESAEGAESSRGQSRPGTQKRRARPGRRRWCCCCLLGVCPPVLSIDCALLLLLCRPTITLARHAHAHSANGTGGGVGVSGGGGSRDRSSPPRRRLRLRAPPLSFKKETNLLSYPH